MKIAYITAGAAGMYCGSCLHDNTLAAELIRQGHDATLVPTYTPITTDEKDVSQRRVFLGGINVYLQQRFPFFRRTPWLLDRLLDIPGLLRWVGRFASQARYEDLGELTISMLRGQHGFQRKEIDKLVAWLKSDVRPQVVHLTNVLLSGLVSRLREELQVPVVASLQGDDIFLEALPAKDRAQALKLIAGHCLEMDGFTATSRYYADFMAGYLGIERERIEIIYPGLNLKGHGGLTRNEGPFTIGYFARICPEKGLHNLVDAFILLKEMPGTPPCKLKVSGWLGDNNKGYLEEQTAKLRARDLLADFDHVDSPDHASKVRFFQALDVLSVPTTYQEPKGLYLLEAWANGVPVVQPRHGSFPELIEATGGGLLVEPGDTPALAKALRHMLDHPAEGRAMGLRGQEVVRGRFNAEAMARETVAWYHRVLTGGQGSL